MREYTHAQTYPLHIRPAFFLRDATYNLGEIGRSKQFSRPFLMISVDLLDHFLSHENRIATY